MCSWGIHQLSTARWKLRSAPAAVQGLPFPFTEPPSLLCKHCASSLGGNQNTSLYNWLPSCLFWGLPNANYRKKPGKYGKQENGLWRSATLIFVFASCLLQVQVSVQPQPEATLTVWVCVQAHREFSLITRDTAFQAIMRCSDSAMGTGRSVEVVGRMTSAESVVPCRYPGLGNQGETKMPRHSCNGARWYNSHTLIMTTHMGNHIFSFSNELSQRMGLTHKVQVPCTDSLKKKSYKWKLICN